MITNMKAKLIYHVKEYHTDGFMEEIKIWEVPKSKDKPHFLKYSFAYIVEGERVVGYDNAEGKGDHRHFKGKQSPSKFRGLENLWADFRKDIQEIKGKTL
jgi:hypothetical protein